jgi:poly-gamma-glutamate synthesis protein (capsule biosynthesis protein)
LEKGVIDLKNFISKLFALCMCLFSLILLLSCNNTPNYPQDTNSVLRKPLVVNEPKQCSIVAAGDLVMHLPVIESVYDTTLGTYNFDPIFSNVKDYITASDLAICNSETSYLQDQSNFTGYPCFNSPTALLTSLKNTGFDILTSAHNHSLDQGVQGVNSTFTAISNFGFDVLGIKNDSKDKNYIIKDLNGIKVGITDYTYSETDDLGNKTLNGIPIPKELEGRINVFDFSHIEEDLENMKSTLQSMKNDGAEFSIFYIHWGNEYELLPSSDQENLASVLNSYGLDVILGSHPHVVQPIRTITNEVSGKKTLVCYSLGNFISNQRAETMGNVRSEDGLMVKLYIYKDSENNVYLKSYETNPTWVNKYIDPTGKISYTVLPIEDLLQTKDAENYGQEVFNKIKDSYNATETTINS